jgi:hypothetical protein
LGLTNSSWCDTNGMTYSERVVKKLKEYQNDDYETIFVDVNFSNQYDSIFIKIYEEFKTKFNIDLKKPNLSEYFSKYVLYGTTFEDKLKELLIKWDSGEINYDWLNKNERYFTRIIDETYGGGFRAHKELIGYPVNLPRNGKCHYDLYLCYELENINKILGFIPEPKDCFRDNFDCILHRRMAIIYRKFGTKSFYQNGKFYNLIVIQKWNQKIIDEKDNPGTKLKYDDVVYIKKNYIDGDMNFGVAALSKKFNVTDGCISFIISGTTWKHVKI